MNRRRCWRPWGVFDHSTMRDMRELPPASRFASGPIARFNINRLLPSRFWPIKSQKQTCIPKRQIRRRLSIFILFNECWIQSVIPLSLVSVFYSQKLYKNIPSIVRGDKISIKCMITDCMATLIMSYFKLYWGIQQLGQGLLQSLEALPYFDFLDFVTSKSQEFENKFETWYFINYIFDHTVVKYSVYLQTKISFTMICHWHAT